MISARFERREVVSDTGEILSESTPYRPGEKIWYYRELADEPTLSDDIPILYEDEHILAVDKPHFLPTTPRGSYIAQTALTKLRVRERNPLLIPIHRLDRPTAGVLLFAKTIQARAPFQTMFQERRVSKSYVAVAPLLPDAHALAQARAGTLQVASRITKVRDELQVRQLSATQCQESGEQSNTLSRIELLASYSLQNTPGARQLPSKPPGSERIHPDSFYPAPNTQLGLYRLHPHTGKTHQLRAHMNLLGAPLLGDVLYPDILPAAPDEQILPLQLLADTLDFEHPMTGQSIHLQSQRNLAFAPLGER
ncbi:MAG: pseudouridine synthase [Rothia sp. (in: high G+C Gram-positive bacteria)]|uniref:pseudouridine synthase n=1 Tax=Rothia sp. (in: high G+C Gram-positive bacteria) TaxID=1885016 RepID=UPI0026DFA8ED|nr:pseudouridine synthase [Rothia sp. (in: high G+C Gram-positive bacteria)]MDO5750562.1 pseudouridine synthase [Rothia sp. (in: high G+C Gram-positive bacteria)]